MDKKFLDTIADKMESVQFLWEQVEKAPACDRYNAEIDFEEMHGQLERLLFDWVAGLIIDPEPDKPEKTSKYYCAIADKAGELGLLLVDMGNYLLDCSKDWRR